MGSHAAPRWTARRVLLALLLTAAAAGVGYVIYAELALGFDPIAPVNELLGRWAR